PAKESVEQVADRAEGVEVGGVATGPQAVVAVAVERRTPVGVGQDLVGLGRLLELALRIGIVGVDVRMQLAGELSKCLLDLLLGSVARDAEHLVWVTGHCSVAQLSAYVSSTNRDSSWAASRTVAIAPA